MAFTRFPWAPAAIIHNAIRTINLSRLRCKNPIQKHAKPTPFLAITGICGRDPGIPGAMHSTFERGYPKSSADKAYILSMSWKNLAPLVRDG